jgi:NitT/TauT family transport system substrate-binding protein
MHRRTFIVLCSIIAFLPFLVLNGPATAEPQLPVLTVGHVGHDHQIALYVAAEEGQALEQRAGVWLKELKPQEVYDLYDHGKPVAQVHVVLVGGGAKMPAALEQGHIEVGLGGLGPVAKFIDKGSAIKVLAPLNNDGDALVLRKDLKAASWKEFVDLVRSSSRPIKIGYKDPLANAYLILVRALSEEGIRFGQEPTGPDGSPVQVITMNLQGDSNMLPSMESGIVDGVVANEPVPSTLIYKRTGTWVADLADLPPAGKWKDHPCCIVAAGEKALKEKRDLIRSLLKAIAAGSDIIKENRVKALAAESKWTRTAPEIGKLSIAQVRYVGRADDAWFRAVGTWFDMMQSSNAFQKELKGKSALDIRSIVFDMTPLNEALSDMPAAGK